MDAATSNPLFQAVDKMLSRASLPDVKAPVDLLALIQEYGDAKYVYGAQSVSDRWHQEYADAPDLGPITSEVERLQGAEFVLLEALRDLEVAANTVASCYTRNPGNFAAALRDLGEYAEKARALFNEISGEQQ